MSQKIKNLLLAVTFLVSVLGFALPSLASAQSSENSLGQTGSVQKAVVCPGGEAHPTGDTQTCAPVKSRVNCSSGQVSQDTTKCAPLGSDCTRSASDTACLKNSAFIKDLNNIVNFLSAAVGVVVIAIIILGGIQYTLAGDNATAQGQAKTRITNALIALFAFIFAYAFLQWLIPGGV